MKQLTIAALLLCAYARSDYAQPAEPILPNTDAKPHYTTPYNVVWTSPSHDAAGSMPLGNGQVGINLWVEEDGDLRFYISRNDSFTEVSRLVKVGGVRISLDPNPFKKGMKFRQELKLADGICEITAGEGKGKVSLKVFVDPDSPVIHVAGQSDLPLKVKAAADIWRTKPRTLAGDELKSSWTLHSSPSPVIESADIFAETGDDSNLAWYHRNETATAFASTIKLQSLEAAGEKAHDPLLHRTFGACIFAGGSSVSRSGERTRWKEFHSVGRHSLESADSVASFALHIAAPCVQSSTAREWLDEAERIVGANRNNGQTSPARSVKAWHDFWDRSHVVAETDAVGEVPGGEHPLRIGYDSDGGNKFPGKILSESVYNKPLSLRTIAEHTKNDPALRNLPPPELVESGPGKSRAIDKDRVKLKAGFTLEAVIRPDALKPGRIFDRLTAGKSDGFLFDTHPGDTLRLIVGTNTLSALRGILQANKVYHVAATYDAATGAMRICLEGNLVAELGGDAFSSVTRAYTLQRYMQAIGGRGPFPIKFNGGQFTVEPKAMRRPFNADWRAWGDCFWWQNTRHMYLPMLAAGDFDLMDPLFDMYEACRPLAEARTKLYHNVEGAYFPETMTVWGTYSNGDYGWNRAGKQPKDVDCGYWRYAWNQGPELVSLMLDRWDYTGDEKFLASRVLPMAQSVLKYFDTRFKRDAGGRIVLDPTQSIETYWHGVINDMPATAGLNDITARLSALPERLTTRQQREFFSRMKATCPPVPLRQTLVDHVMKPLLCRLRDTNRPVRTTRAPSCTPSGHFAYTASAVRDWTRLGSPTNCGTITSMSAGDTTATALPGWG